jgi:hypothetical protein
MCVCVLGGGGLTGDPGLQTRLLISHLSLSQCKVSYVTYSLLHQRYSMPHSVLVFHLLQLTSKYKPLVIQYSTEVGMATHLGNITWCNLTGN